MSTDRPNRFLTRHGLEELGGLQGPPGPQVPQGPQGPPGLNLPSGAVITLREGVAAPPGYTLVGTTVVVIKKPNGSIGSVTLNFRGIEHF